MTGRQADAKAREERLVQQLSYVVGQSPFYRDRLGLRDGTGPVPPLCEWPLVSKPDVLADQAAMPPFGRNLCVPSGAIRRVHQTSGTTARALILALTAGDARHTVEVGSACFRSAGLREDDLVVHCLNYTMWAGGYTDHQSLEATGAGVIPYGVGNSRKLIETILQVRPTTIHCTPSYLAKLELLLKDDFQLAPADLGLRLGLFGGESGLQNRDFRRHIEALWGFRVMNANYGMADVLSMFGSECRERCGLHFFGDDKLVVELIDPGSESRLEMAPGTVGEMVLTNLCKEAQPMVRYRTRDMVRILATEPCACGENGFRFEIVGRSDDMLVVRGLNVFPSTISSVVNAHLDRLGGVHRILVDRDPPIEQMVIEAELRADSSEQADAAADIQAAVVSHLREATNLTPDLRLVPFGSLPRTEGKSAKLLRVLDKVRHV